MMISDEDKRSEDADSAMNEHNILYQSHIAEVDNYKTRYMAKMRPETIIKCAHNILSGNVDLGYADLDKPLFFDNNRNIVWNYSDEIKKNANTFYLYFLGLQHVYILSAAYLYTNEIEFLKCANDIICSFENNLSNGLINSEMLFNDHAQSERIENVVFYYNTAQKAKYNKCEKSVAIIIENAVEKLLGDKYYQRNHNHGIIVDKACLIGVYFLNPQDCYSKLDYIIQRLKKQVDYAFASDGIHKENSIDYHYIVMDLLLGCLRVCEKIGHPFYVELSEKVKNVSDYPVYALKPNRERPLFGDSKGVRIDQIGKISSIDVFDNKELQYIGTEGYLGEKPNFLTKAFSSGYVFLRQHFERENFKEATWLSIKAGYSTRVHKHQDDLSLCLYSKGYDVFIDPGMLGYMPKDKYKDYVESIPAHTTIGIKDCPYSICSSNGEKFRVQQVICGKEYDYVRACSKVYNDTSIYRHLYYLRKIDVIIIRDEIYSKSTHTFNQFFHLGPDMMLKTSDDKNDICIGIAKTGYSVTISQVNDYDDVRVLDGEKTEPMSLISTGFSTFAPTKTICFEKTGSDIEFITVIDIHNQKDKCCINRIEDGVEIIKDDSVNVTFSKTKPVEFGCVLCKQYENELIITNDSEDFVKHTVYIFDDESNEILKFPYTKERDLHIKLEKFKNAKLIYFVSNDYGEILKGVLGYWTETNDNFLVFNKYRNIVIPNFLGCFVENIGEKIYKYTVDIDYFDDKNVMWWVYKNGALLKTEFNNSSTKIVKFDDNGEYVIMCSMRDRYFGEFFFYQFDKVVINDIS